jgi:subtilisin-like proprotein convertase family protein
LLSSKHLVPRRALFSSTAFAAFAPLCAVAQQPVAGPACLGFAATSASFVDPVGGALNDNATTSFTLTVSGAGNYLWDVDLTTFITHTWCADLDISLTSPASTTARIAFDFGGANDDVFNGTVWDDAPDAAITDTLFVNGNVAATLNPEWSLDIFRGENPNGPWKLLITDDTAGEAGNLSSWTLDITSLSSAPYEATSTFSRAPNLLISSVGTPILVDPLTVAGLGPTLSKVAVYTEIAHTWCSDLDVQLTAPSGSVVKLTTDNAGSFDNCFNGTTWDDDVPGNCARYNYADNIVATLLAPEGALGGLLGQDPNGVWTLTVADDSASDGGQFVRWSLILTTCDAAPPPVVFCTSGTTSNGCNATISASTQPSASFAHGCVITIVGAETQKSGLVFYGTDNNAFTPIPWGAGNTSFLCVKGPLQRSPAQDSGGDLLVGPCEGVLQLDWNAYRLANPGSLGSPFGVGQDVFVQGWFRDPPAPTTTNLSNAIQLTTQP